MSIDREMDRGYGGDNGNGDGWYDTYRPRRDGRRYRRGNGNGHGNGHGNGTSSGPNGMQGWHLRTPPCDVCGERPGTVLYWHFAEGARFSAPPSAGVLVCRGFCQDVVEQYASMASGARGEVA